MYLTRLIKIICVVVTFAWTHNGWAGECDGTSDYDRTFHENLGADIGYSYDCDGWYADVNVTSKYTIVCDFGDNQTQLFYPGYTKHNYIHSKSKFGYSCRIWNSNGLMSNELVSNALLQWHEGREIVSDVEYITFTMPNHRPLKCFTINSDNQVEESIELDKNRKTGRLKLAKNIIRTNCMHL